DRHRSRADDARRRRRGGEGALRRPEAAPAEGGPGRQRQDGQDHRRRRRLRPPPPALPQADDPDEQVHGARRAERLQAGRHRADRGDPTALQAQAVGRPRDRAAGGPDL
ncbi:MAG: SSU ribosomal protein S17p (S11e), partial [uncultured Thermomicrobiales bacterium]